MRVQIDKWLERLLVLMMASMVLNVTWQVLSRFIMSSPSQFTEEAARYLMIWLGFLGASYVAGKKAHPGIDLLAAKLHGAAAKRLQVFIHSLILIFAVIILVVGGGYLVSMTHELNQTSAALQLPLWVVYLCVPISGVLLVYYSIQNIKQS